MVEKKRRTSSREERKFLLEKKKRERKKSTKEGKGRGTERSGQDCEEDSVLRERGEWGPFG